MKPRVIQPEATFCAREWVEEYDEIARRAMAPVFKHFALCVERTGIKGGRVLDIGAGSARLLLAVAKRKGLDFDLVGIDISREMVSKALENTRKAGLDAELPLATATQLPFRDSSFDLVISSSSLHMWSDPVSVFNEIQRVMKPGGVSLIRDARRLPESWFWRLYLYLSAIIRGMGRRERNAWRRALMAGYTIEETRELLNRSALQNWRVGRDKMVFELMIEARTPSP